MINMIENIKELKELNNLDLKYDEVQLLFGTKLLEFYKGKIDLLVSLEKYNEAIAMYDRAIIVLEEITDIAEIFHNTSCESTDEEYEDIEKLDFMS